MADEEVLPTARRLRERGLRVTAARLAVLEVMPARGHRTVEQIATAARERLGSVSTQAVYDILGALAAAGLLRRIEPAGSPALYETRTGDNHHHVVCRRCGRTADIDCVVGVQPCLEPSYAAGFILERPRSPSGGHCAECSSTATS